MDANARERLLAFANLLTSLGQVATLAGAAIGATEVHDAVQYWECVADTLEGFAAASAELGELTQSHGGALQGYGQEDQAFMGMFFRVLGSAGDAVRAMSNLSIVDAGLHKAEVWREVELYGLDSAQAARLMAQIITNAGDALGFADPALRPDTDRKIR